MTRGKIKRLIFLMPQQTVIWSTFFCVGSSCMVPVSLFILVCVNEIYIAMKKNQPWPTVRRDRSCRWPARGHAGWGTVSGGGRGTTRGMSRRGRYGTMCGVPSMSVRRHGGLWFVAAASRRMIRGSLRRVHRVADGRRSTRTTGRWIGYDGHNRERHGVSAAKHSPILALGRGAHQCSEITCSAFQILKRMW